MLGWILSVILIISGLIIYYKVSKIPSQWLSYHYNERVAYFKELNKRLKAGGIVFLGDSITEHFIVSEFFSEHFVINRGISGDTTDGVLKRLKESIYDLKPSKIFLMIGTNDLGDGKEPEYIINNIEKIIKKIHERLPETIIFLEYIYPVRKDGDNKIKKRMVGKRNNESINKINEGITKISDKYQITNIDIHSLLQDKYGDLKLEYTVEGLHLTPLGYGIVVKEIEKYL